MKKHIIKISLLGFLLSLTFCNDESPTTPPSQEKSLILLSPIGGETYFVNDTLKIKWESQNVEFVDIYLSIDNGTNWEQLAEKMAATINEYSFTLNEIVSEQSLIKISDNNDPTIVDISDSTFAIIEPIEPMRNFFPLAVGNTWVYQVEKKSYPDWQAEIYNERVSIVGTRELDQKQYFDFLITTTEGNETHEYYYIDESTKMVYIYNDYTETGQQFADLSLSEGTHEWISGASVIVTENEENILGELREVKQYDYYAPFSRWKHNFTENIGITYKWSSDESYLITKEILGALIDNVLFGDTTFYENIGSLPDDTLNYYPLRVNDYYIFSDTLQKWGQEDKITKIKKEITEEVLIENQAYYKIVETNSENINSPNIYYERVSEDGKIYWSDGSTVKIIDDLSTELYDRNYFYRFGYYDGWTTYNEFESYSKVSIDGSTYSARNYFTMGAYEFDAKYSLLFDFGLYQYQVRNGYESTFRKGRLIGGRKNGVLWGEYQFP